LKFYPVSVPNDPSVGCPPDSVDARMIQLFEVITSSLNGLDAGHRLPNSQVPDGLKVAYTVAVTCRVFTEFLEVHPLRTAMGTRRGCWWCASWDDTVIGQRDGQLTRVPLIPLIRNSSGNIGAESENLWSGIFYHSWYPEWPQGGGERARSRIAFTIGLNCRLVPRSAASPVEVRSGPQDQRLVAQADLQAGGSLIRRQIASSSLCSRIAPSGSPVAFWITAWLPRHPCKSVSSLKAMTLYRNRGNDRNEDADCTSSAIERKGTKK